jgi:5-bromo-4-chloroindolyl phosphate hydrolysis protein
LDYELNESINEMSGILNTGLQFWQLITAILTVVLGVVAIRISLTLDINKYLEGRRKSYIPKIRNACTHLSFTKGDDGQIGVQSYFISPPGTLQWQCQRCGMIKYQQDGDFERDVEYYSKNIDEYKKKNKRFNKLLKKSGMV